MKKLFTAFVALVIVTANAQAQAPDSEFDDLSLNGMASYEQLRKEYYIGALYLESISQDAESIIRMQGKKRMEMRITIEKWSPRRFSQQWNQAILINNDQDAHEEFSQQILGFTQIPRKDLEANDRIVVDMDPVVGTTVYLNRQKILSTPNNAFFDVLLNTWIGQRPPSSSFKNNILTLPTDQAGTDLLTAFDATETSKSRETEVANWLKTAKKEKTTKTDGDTSSPTSVAPPGSGTKVTARRTHKAAPKVSAATAVAVSAAATAPKTKPTIALAKPTLDTVKPTPSKAKAAVAKATPKPQPEPEPKPQPEPKTVVAKVNPPNAVPPAEINRSAKEMAQESLKRTYRSNILKIAYLNTQYPRRAMDLKQEGLVVLKITLSRKGKLLDVVPKVSSQHRLLDNAARSAVKKSSPFPAPPRNLEGSKIELTLPFNFKL